MLAADVAQRAVAQRGDDAAQPGLVQKGAALVLAQHEMRGAVLPRDAAPQLVAQIAGQFLIFLQCLRVHVDLPTDAAAVRTARRDAAKVREKVRFHTQQIRHAPFRVLW